MHCYVFRHIFSLILLWTLLPAHADSRRTQKQVDRLMLDCGVQLGTGGQNAARNALRNRIFAELEAHAQKAIAAREKLWLIVEKLLPLEKAENNEPGNAPKISDKTMRALLHAYGDESFALNYSDRMKAMGGIKEILNDDVYFKWLRQKSLDPRVDPVTYFLQVLNIGGSARLPLSSAIMRLQAALDPTFPLLSAGAVNAILGLHAREFLIGEYLYMLRSHTDPGAWDLAPDLSVAKASRKRLLQGLRDQAGAAFPLATYEKIKAFLRDENPDTEILRRHLLAVDGIYAGKLPQQEVEFLNDEARRIRADMGLDDSFAFDKNFLALWPLIWGQNQSYEMVLIRRFYQPERERQAVENQLRSLNRIIELGEALQSDRSFFAFVDGEVRRQAGRFPYMLAF